MTRVPKCVRSLERRQSLLLVELDELGLSRAGLMDRDRIEPHADVLLDRLDVVVGIRPPQDFIGDVRPLDGLGCVREVRQRWEAPEQRTREGLLRSLLVTVSFASSSSSAQQTVASP